MKHIKNSLGNNRMFVLIFLSLWMIGGPNASAQTAAPSPTPDTLQKPFDKLSKDFDYFGKQDDKATQEAVNAQVNAIAKQIGEGKLDEAFAGLNEIIKAHPGNANAYDQRASVYQLREKFDLAQRDLDKALELDPRNATAYALLGVQASHAGDRAGCIANSTKAIELDPNLEVAYYNRGTSYVLQYDLTAAINDLTKAIALNPNRSESYLNRAAAKGFGGDLDGRIDDLVAALEVNSNNQLAQRLLDGIIKSLPDKQVEDTLRTRIEGLTAKYAASKVQSTKFSKLLDSKPADATVCESLNETLLSFNEEKTAWQRAKIVRHLGNLPSLQETIKYVDDIGVQIGNLDKIFASISAEHKCK